MRENPAAELLDVIHQVRRRWRMKLALRGALAVSALGLLLFVVSARALEAARFTPQAIVTFRIVLAAAVAALVAYLLVRPLVRRVRDEQVAMYLEEHEPTLQASIISAIEAGRDTSTLHSQMLVRRLVEEAIQKTRAIEYGKRVERKPVRRYAATIAAVTAAAIALFAFGPAYLRHAGSALFMLSRDVEAAVPYRIDVKPGNATVAKGADQVISAELAGFDAADAVLMVRKQQADAQFERFPMVRGDSGAYDGMLFDLAVPVQYFVEAAGVSSPTYTLRVVELPYVQKLQLEYHFPSYTGLPPQKVEEGGDIAVLRGTQVRVRAVPTMATSGGHVVLEKVADVVLTAAADGALTGSFKVDRNDLYHLDMNAPTGERVTASPQYTIDVLADQVISAELAGFDAADAVLMVKKQQADAQFERFPMVRGDSGAYDGLLFDLAVPVQYFVEAAGVSSPTYTLKVVELPYVQKLQLEYHFPSYTGLPPQKVEEGGDIAVLRGTQVRVRAVPTMATSGGHIVLEKVADVVLTPAADGALTGSFKVDRNGFYHLDMKAPTGERVTASPQYTIDVLADQPPTVSIAKPGRDTTASPIEEVFVEARADDDFGVRNLELVYSVNGGAEKTVRLFDGQKRMSEVSAGHTFYLEELTLKAGDSVSYYARATDNDGVQGAKPATSDIYFVKIRPLSKDFRRAQSQASGGGGQQQNDGNLSDQQRRIIAATFNVQRDRKALSADKLRQNVTVIALSQTKLREQVEALLMQMTQRLGGDEAFRKIMALLSQAILEMKNAEGKLQAAAPDAALPPEQKALQLLQQAEEEYEVQVQAQQQGGGGGGGQQQDRDLSDLFELEVDKMANQYEMRQQASQQQADQKLDEIAEKLKELARRQEQEAERQRRRAAAGQTGSAGGAGNSQRELADQVEEAARRLEQLSRDENRADLIQSAQQLRQAADAMRRAAANGQQASGAQSAEALERLRQAEGQLQRSQTGRAERDVADAARRAEELVNEQKDVASQVRGLGSPAERSREQVQPLLDRKTAMEQKVGDLEKQIDRAAADMRRDERNASRKMTEAAAAIRDNRVRDKIRYSGSMVRSGMATSDTENFEREIGSNLEAVRNRLHDAQTALGQTRPDPQAAALNRARQLARSVESLGERARERQGQQGAQRTQEGGRGVQGQQGQGSREGQPGQGGREGQPGQQGQGGRNDGQRTQDGRGGEGDTTGAPQSGGSFVDRRPWRGMSPQDARQFRAEVRQLTMTAEQLRRSLQKIDQQALNDILKKLRELDSDRVFQDPAAFDRLQSQAAEAVKRFEFNLRRRSELKGNEVLLSGDGDVPEEFRKLVEQYYKSLSKAPEKKQ